MNEPRRPNPSEIPDNGSMWGHLNLSQIGSVIKSQEELRNKVLDFFPDLPHMRVQDGSLRDSSRRNMCNKDFFQSAKFDCIATMASRYLPTQAVEQKLGGFAKGSIANILSDFAPKNVEETKQVDIQDQNSSHNYFVDNANFNHVGASDSTLGITYNPDYGMSYQGGYAAANQTPYPAPYPSMNPNTAPTDDQSHLSTMNMPYPYGSAYDTTDSLHSPLQ